MKQYRLMGQLLTFATLGALSSVGCFVVDDKKSDDENGGESAGGSTGTGGTRPGTGGSKATGGSTATGGVSGTGGDCAADGLTCSVNGDCCGFPDSYCVGGACAPLCTTNSECATGCCAALTGGGSACGPASICEGGTGGSGAGGTSSTGGSSTGGVSTGGTGGGTGAVLKFCNNLTKNSADVTLRLDFGGVSTSAITGTCTPAVGQNCTTIPTGMDITANLYDGATLLFEGSFTLVEAGDELLILAVLDDTIDPPQPMLDGGPLLPEFVCSEMDYTDVFPPAALESKSFHFGSSTKTLNAARNLPLLRQGLGQKLSGYRSIR